MQSVRFRQLLQVVWLIIVGLVINRFGADLAIKFELPLYLDCIGTIFATVLGGFCPGAIVGFVTNFIGGFSESSTFYYGTINVLIAVCAGIAAERGAFQKIYRLPKLLFFLMLLSIPCSFLSYFLFDFQIAQNVVTPIAESLHQKGLPILLSQILADFCTEVPDKAISILSAFFLLKLTPSKFYTIFDSISGREHRDHYKIRDHFRSLKAQVTGLLFVSSFALAVVATAVAYKAYSEAEIHQATLLSESVNRLVADAIQNADTATLTRYIDELEHKHPQILTITPGMHTPKAGSISVVCTETPYPVCTEFNLSAIRTSVALFCTKIFSTLFGLLLCVVFAAILFANHRVVYPIHELTEEMENFGYDSAIGRTNSISRIRSLDVETGNEIENLHAAIIKAVEEIDLYINKSEEQANSIAHLQTNIITILGDLVENRDETTGGHVKRTASYAEIIARRLMEDGKKKGEIDEKFVSAIHVAAPLHDIGKIRIPDAILNKPGKLNDEEFSVMKKHTIYGREMLNFASENLGEIAYLNMAKDIALSHHEWWDGSRGYPERIQGEAIPLSARIMAVADVFDALVSIRPYKAGFPFDKAMAIIQEESGTHFDPEIVEAFVKSRDEIKKVMGEA
ncbi:MAG: HD-GYP domain-containing protein [Fibrobacter sp.]|nr:HD-GYP domain-containing protein [Fibrobacter sp.]